jgi:hypothetical protein
MYICPDCGKMRNSRYEYHPCQGSSQQQGAYRACITKRDKKGEKMENLSEAICKKCGAYPCLCSRDDKLKSQYVKEIREKLEKYMVKANTFIHPDIGDSVYFIKITPDEWQQFWQKIGGK